MPAHITPLTTFGQRSEWSLDGKEIFFVDKAKIIDKKLLINNMEIVTVDGIGCDLYLFNIEQYEQTKKTN